MTKSDDDQYMVGLLQRHDREEAAGWLQRGGENYYIGELDHQASQNLVDTIYRLGAERVEVVDLGKNDGLVSTDHIIVTLPSLTDVRENLFRWNNDRVAAMGLDGDKDNGQDHLLVWFD
jgi:hypothetical protein